MGEPDTGATLRSLYAPIGGVRSVFSRYRNVDGSAESIPLAPASVELVTAAQAFGIV